MCSAMYFRSACGRLRCDQPLSKLGEFGIVVAACARKRTEANNSILALRERRYQLTDDKIDAQVSQQIAHRMQIGYI
jgi:hypothetical protein